jgi:retron-type reverse transcriptase
LTENSLNTKGAWQDYFLDVGLPSDISFEYASYASNLLERGLPVIFDWHHLAALLGVSVDYIRSVHNASEYHYRIFSIPKRSGGSRDIEAPRAALKRCQQWILKNILEKVDAHEAAKGFLRKRSIINHAKPHLRSGALLKMDFKNFFPSIKKRRVIALFKSLGFSGKVSLYLASICCLNDRLPQGAPTSPYLSNLICKYFDFRMSGLAAKKGWVYTRYADDIAISGGGVAFGLSKFVERIASEEGFAINKKKTKLYPVGARRVLTGIVLGDDSVSVPRSYKRELSKVVYYVEKFGLLSHVSKIRKKQPLLLDSLRGKIGFWRFVEPGNEKAKRLLAKLNASSEQLNG